MYLRTFIVIQMVQYIINLVLHLVLCAKLYRRDPNKALISGISCLIVTMIVISFYYLPIYRDYNNSIYEFGIPFVRTGNKTVDRVSTQALFCLPLILLTYAVLYFALRKSQAKFPLYNYRDSKFMCRAIFFNMIAAALIDLLITRVFLGDESAITVVHAIGKLIVGVSSFVLVYFPALLCMTSKAAQCSQIENVEEDSTTPREESLFQL